MLEKTALLLILTMVLSCNHDFTSDTLDLGTYQWNMWPDTEATPGPDSLYIEVAEINSIPQNPPSCGWEEFHRGNGNLIRIPAQNKDQFSIDEGAVVTWFHCRHTLPDLWAHRDVTLQFKGVSCFS